MSDRRLSQRLFAPAFVHVLLVQGCFGLSWSTYLLLPKYLTSELSESGSVIGIVLGIPPATGALLIPLVGRALDRIGRRPVAIAGNVAMLSYALGFLWVDRVGPYLYALQLLQGMAFTLTFNAAGTLAAEAPSEKLRQAMRSARSPTVSAFGRPSSSALAWRRSHSAWCACAVRGGRSSSCPRHNPQIPSSRLLAARGRKVGHRPGSAHNRAVRAAASPEPMMRWPSAG